MHRHPFSIWLFICCKFVFFIYLSCGRFISLHSEHTSYIFCSIIFHFPTQNNFCIFQTKKKRETVVEIVTRSRTARVKTSFNSHSSCASCVTSLINKFCYNCKTLSKTKNIFLSFLHSCASPHFSCWLLYDFCTRKKKENQCNFNSTKHDIFGRFFFTFFFFFLFISEQHKTLKTKYLSRMSWLPQNVLWFTARGKMVLLCYKVLEYTYSA